MENKVAIVAATPDPTHGQTPPASRPDPGTHKASAATGPDPVDLRLVIEEDKASGSYVYKQINRRTGEVLTQFPRDEILKMHRQKTYEAGQVIRTKA